MCGLILNDFWLSRDLDLQLTHDLINVDQRSCFYRLWLHPAGLLTIVIMGFIAEL